MLNKVVVSDASVPSQVTDRNWPMVVAAGVGLTLSLGTLLVSSFGVFVRPLSAEFGWSRTALFGAVAASQYALAASGWAWGSLVDRFGPRAVLLPSVVIISVLFASLSLLTQSIWHLYLVCAAVPLLAGGASPLGYSGALVRAFDGRLGLALGLALTGIGVGGAFLPPLATFLVNQVGWRGAFAAIGLLTLVITFPAAVVATQGLTGPVHRAINAVPIRVGSLVRTRAYILVCLCFVLLGAVSIGAMANYVPMMVDRGFTPGLAASLASLIGVATIVFRVASGFLVDRIHARFVLAGIAALAAAAMLVLMQAHSVWAASSAAILLGAVFGAEADLLAFLVSRYFGSAAFGKLYGLAFGLFVLGVGTGPLLLGASFDRLGGYRPGLFGFALVCIVAAVLALTLPAYQRRA